MDTSLLVAAAICLLVTLILKKLFDSKKTPPGPWGLPVIGYLPFLGRDKPYVTLQRLGKKYGNIFSIRLGSQYVIVLNDFQSTKDALGHDIFIGRPPDLPFEFNKESIETQAFHGLPWKDQRRFSLHMLRDLGFGKSKMEGHIQEEITELLEHFERHEGKPFFFRELLGSSMSNNIGSLVFGKRLKYDDPVRQMLTKAVNDSSAEASSVVWQIFFPWLASVLRFLHIGDVDRMHRVTEQLKNYIGKEIKEHESSLDPSNIRDFIDGYLLEIEKRKNNTPSFNKSVLQDLVGAFFGGGSETVRVSVEWLLLSVASRQDCQRRIQAEIDEVTGRNRLPVYTDLKSMPYTEAFILELWRWRPIIPLNLMHYTLADTELGGFFIPQHSQILANIWSIHHDPEYWGKDVEEFRPERFLSDDGKSIKKFDQFIPFAIGKRACPGEPLARVEVFLYFTSILQKFNFRLPEGKVADFNGILGGGLQPKPQELILTARK